MIHGYQYPALPPITVSSEDKEHYTALIDDILSTADLETISRKKVRQALEAALGGKDLSEQKASITRHKVHVLAPQKTNPPGVF
jgi:hypothetical protein